MAALAALFFLFQVARSQWLVPETCVVSDSYTKVNPDADVTIGVILNVHERGEGVYGCGRPSRQGVEVFEAMRWAVSLLNQDYGEINRKAVTESFIPGVKIGLQVYDSCNHPDVSTKHVTSLFPVLKSGSMTCRPENGSLLAGLIEMNAISENRLLIENLRRYLIPVISVRNNIVPAEQLARVLAEIAHDLEWERFAIIHSQDEHSFQVTKKLGQISQNGKPCIIATHSIPSEHPVNLKLLKNMLITFTNRLENKTAVLVIMDEQTLTGLMRVMSEVPDVVRRLQWLFSWIPPETELANIINGSQIYSVSPYPSTIQQFESYWSNLHTRKATTSITDRWFLNFFTYNNQCRLKGDPSLCTSSIEQPVTELRRTSRFLAAFHAVSTYAHALKKSWEVLCDSVPGICNAFRQMARQQFIGQFLESVDYYHSDSNRSPPEMNGQRVSTNREGEITGLKLALTLYRMDSERRLHYTQAVAYDADHAEVVDTNAKYIPSLCPKEGCNDCIKIRQSRMEEDKLSSQDIIIIGKSDALLIPVILPIHKTGSRPFECSSVINGEAIQDLEAILWTLDKINADSAFLPGIELGIAVMDTCSSAMTIRKTLGNFIAKQTEQWNGIALDSAVAAIASTASSEVEAAVTMLSPFNITVISTKDVQISEDNLGSNPYLFQIAQPASNGVKVTIDLLKYLGWSFVSLIYDNDPSYKNAVTEFKKLAAQQRICSAIDVSLENITVTDTVIELAKAKEKGGRAVVTWLSESSFRAILDEIKISNDFYPGEILWIINGEWSENWNIVKDRELFASGALLIRPQRIDFEEFSSYYQKLTPNNNARNIWFSEYWQQKLGCSDTECSPLPYYPTSSSSYSSQAVIALAAGLTRLRDYLCSTERGLCSKMLHHHQLRPAISQYIQYTASGNPENSDNLFTFTSTGYGNIPFDIYFFRRSALQSYSYRKVATYHNGLINMTNLVTHNIEGQEIQFDDQRSECIADCGHCFNGPVDWLFSDSPDRLYIAATISVHKSSSNPLQCGPLTSTSIQNVEAFLWALDQLNMHPDILPGIHMGALLLDSCSSREKTARDVSNLFSHSLISPSEDVKLPLTNEIVGFIAGDHSINVIDPVVDVTIPLNITTVAPTASHSIFNDLERYPSLLRLSPPNNILADGMISVLKHFHWTYISLLFGDEHLDLYNAFISMAQQRGIILALNEKITSSSSSSLEGVVSRLQWKQKQGSKVIVVLLNSNHLDRLLTVVENYPDFGHPIWFAPETIHVFYRHPELSLGAISIRSESSPVPSFMDYFVNLHIRNNTRNSWFSEYWEKKFKCRGSSCFNIGIEESRQGTFLQDVQIPGIINAVFTLAQGLEKVRQQVCPTKLRGVCPQMRNMENLRQLIIENSKKLTFIGIDNKIVRFRSHNYNPGSFDIYNFMEVGSNAQAFVTIGRFNEDEGLHINASRGRGYNDAKKQVSLYNIRSVCNNTEDCPPVKSKPTNIMEILPAEGTSFVIGAIAPVHRSGSTFFSCGQLNNEQIFQNIIALSYAINQVNKNSSILPNIKLGLTIFDYCNRYQKAEGMLYNYYSEDGDSIHSNPKSLLAALTFDNEVAEIISPIAEAVNITQIIIPAVSGKKMEAESLLSTTSSPSVLNQIKIITKILLTYNWRSVYLIYSEDEFGKFGKNEFTVTAKNNDICISGMLEVDVDKSTLELIDIFQENIQNKIGVVILLTEDTEVAKKVAEASIHHSILSNTQWIITDGWSREIITHDKTIVIKTDNKELPDFKKYVSSLSLGKHDSIPDQWFEEFWQRKFQCRLSYSKSIQVQYQTECSREERLNEEEIVQAKFVSQTIDSVYAVTNGLNKYLKKYCLWAGASVGIDDCGVEARMHLAKAIQEEISSSENGCSDCDNSIVAFGFQIYQIRNVSSTNQIVKVGYWKGQELVLRKDEIKVKTNIIYKCQNDQIGTKERQKSWMLKDSIFSNFKTLWGIILTSLSLLGIVLVIICALYFLVSFPVTVGTTVLGYMVLFGLLILYTVNFAFIVSPTESTCGIRRFTLGLAYSIIFSGLLVKVINMWRMMGYHGNRMLNDGTKLSSPAGLLVIAVGLVLIQIILTAAWLILIPPKIGLYNGVWRCSPPSTSEEELVISLVYVMLLLLITILFSLLTWKCQDNNRESRWILACCLFVTAIWIAWTILWTHLPLRYRDATTVIANLICATTVMLLLYLRKVYLYSKLTRQARDREMTASLQPSTYAPSLYGTLQKSNITAVLYGSQASLNGKMYGGGSRSRSAWFTDDAKSDSSGSVQVQATDLYPLDMYDGGSQFQPIYGNKHLMMVDDSVSFAR
ncbi:uncharacterized protein [Centruroides vittatus]|uniref:uncharacterized protein n=1 Tax=Centruroides vittatus TaxID=120091 RepID=UPI00350ECFF8